MTKPIARVRSIHCGSRQAQPEVLLVLLQTDDGLLLLDGHRMIGVNDSRIDPNDDYTLFLPFTHHLESQGEAGLAILDFKVSIDGDVFLLLSDGSIVSLRHELLEHSDPGSLRPVLRFASPQEIDPMELDYIRSLVSGAF